MLRGGVAYYIGSFTAWECLFGGKGGKSYFNTLAHKDFDQYEFLLILFVCLLGWQCKIIVNFDEINT